MKARTTSLELNHKPGVCCLSSAFARRLRWPRPSPCGLADEDPTADIDEVEQFDDLSIAHPDTPMGDRLADQVFVVRAVQVDVAPQAVDAAASVDGSIEALQPECTAQHPVSTWILLEQVRADLLSRPSPAHEHSADGAPRPDLGADAVFTYRRLRASCLAAQSRRCGRYRVAYDLAGFQKANHLLASGVYMEEIDVGHRGAG